MGFLWLYNKTLAWYTELLTIAFLDNRSVSVTEWDEFKASDHYFWWRLIDLLFFIIGRRIAVISRWILNISIFFGIKWNDLNCDHLLACWCMTTDLNLISVKFISLYLCMMWKNDYFGMFGFEWNPQSVW